MNWLDDLTKGQKELLMYGSLGLGLVLFFFVWSPLGILSWLFALSIFSYENHKFDRIGTGTLVSIVLGLLCMYYISFMAGLIVIGIVCFVFAKDYWDSENAKKK